MEVIGEAAFDEGVELVELPVGSSHLVVVAPSGGVPVDASDEVSDGHPALLWIDDRAQVFSFGCHRFGRCSLPISPCQ